MKFQAITGNFAEAGADALAVAVFKGEKPTEGILQKLDKITGGLVAPVFKADEFKGDVGETALITIHAEGQGDGESFAARRRWQERRLQVAHGFVGFGNSHKILAKTQHQGLCPSRQKLRRQCC